MQKQKQSFTLLDVKRNDYDLSISTRRKSFLSQGYDFLLEYKVSIDYNLKMPRLIIFIDKDPHAIWEDLQKNGKVMKCEIHRSFLFILSSVIELS